ncbi:MAG: hypothetical protein ACYDCO_12975 [Armatimonadota bacterium]
MIAINGQAAHRLAAEIVNLLAASPAVAAVSLFGSLAEERADAWSDVDLHVACASEAGRWAAAAAIRAGKPVEFYRTFSAAPQPSGRYWFTDESPFQKIDISFFTIAEYRAMQARPIVLGQPITLREVYTQAVSAASESAVEPLPLDLSGEEIEIGRRVYRLSLSARVRARGKADGQHLEEDIAGLRAAFGDLPPDFTAGGGHLGRLAARMLAYAEYIRAHYPL